VSVDGVVALITAGGAILITIFTYKTSKDYGETVRKFIEPVNQSLGGTTTALAQTQTLLGTLVTKQDDSIRDMAKQVRGLRRTVERMESRLGGDRR
jgi:hypothetical protein